LEESKKRIQAGIIKGIHLRCLFRCILVAFPVICFCYAPAFAVGFITEREFASEKSIYKDYPLKLLFRKLAESKASEKREIRTLIILKQVFDRDEKAKAGILEFKESFGIIKDISEEKLRLWLPDTEGYKDYYVGINRIPLECDEDCEITKSKIGEYASRVYTLDERIYKIRIDFQLAIPTGLHVKRDDNINIVGWNEALSTGKPTGYRIFLNGAPFKTVDGTTVKVPRTKGRVDKYYVKAVYRHGKSLIDSGPSDVLHDEITAKEIQQELVVRETYDKIIDALTPLEWEKAKELLNNNRQLISKHLDRERKENVDILIDIFKDIDAGDRIRRTEPEGIKEIEMALEVYRRAEQKADTLPGDIDVKFIADQKIKKGLDRKALLETKNKELLATEKYNQIMATLNPEDYEKARKLLYDNSQLMIGYLDEERQENIEILIGVFQDIDKGDQISLEQPENIRNLGRALRLYNRAEQKAKALPEDINVLFITKLKISVASDRRELLETMNKEQLAGETYDRIIASLTPVEWEEAKKLLYDNSQVIKEYLDKERQENIKMLIGVFQDIDEGDQFSRKLPETAESLETALVLYQRAEQKAKALPAGIDLLFITNLKIKNSLDRKAMLDARNKELMAEAKYNQIIAALNPAGWEGAKELLYENRQLIAESENQERKENVESLVGLFKDTNEGDRISREQPESIKNLETALALYKRAGQKAKNLPSSIDVQFIADLKSNKTLNRKSLLESRRQEFLAARKAEEASRALPKKPEIVKVYQPKEPERKYDRSTEILWALKEFEAKNYVLSMNRFMNVFSKQINNIKGGGKKRVYGILGLPVECRAEIIFLIELDLLKSKNENKDAAEFQQGLEEINERIENREGLWVIIRDELKMSKIKRHIALFNVDAL